jgi:hypothetical protein
MKPGTFAARPESWRTHSCVPRPDSSGRPANFAHSAMRRHEWRRGTHECVRHIAGRVCEKWRAAGDRA